MSILRQTPGLALLATLGLGTAVLLGGCALLPSIPDFGSGSNDSSSESSDDATDDDNSLEDDIEDNPFIEQTVPDTFPDDVPRPELEILLALDLGTGWTIAYKTDDAIDDFNELADRFADDGWEELSRLADGGQAFAAYDSAEYQVQLSAATEDTGYDTPILSMTVVRKD